METVVVEREFEEPVTPEMMRALAEEHGCNDLYRVTLMRSYRSADGHRVICVYHAPDAEAVRMVQRSSTIPFTLAYSSTEHAAAENG